MKRRMDDLEQIFLFMVIAVIIEVVVIAVCCAFLPGTVSEPKPCEMKIYQYMDEHRINTSCGHIVIDRCPFCDKRVEIVVE